MQIPDSSKPEDLAPIPGKFEAAQRRAKVDTFHQGKDLEAAAEHFRMKQRLQSALRFFSGDNLGERRDDAGEKMMLVGKSVHAQAIFLGSVSDVGPVDVRTDIGLADFLERRIEMPMAGADLNYLAEFTSREPVIDH